MPPEINFETPSGVLNLYRFPIDPQQKLRAWDAADEYVLSHLEDAPADQQRNRILVLGDAFGAMSLGLSLSLSKDQSSQNSKITVVSDSAVAHSAIAANAAENEIDTKNINLISSIGFSELAEESTYDLVIVKIPKSLAQLEDSLSRIQTRVTADTQIIGAGMVKTVHNSTLALFEKYIGQTTSSLAKKKARLIFASAEAYKAEIGPVPAKVFTVSAHISKTPDDLTLASYPGVFCHGSLDYGTQFLLKAMQVSESEVDILDLGCGTGALGIAAAKRSPDSKVTFVDESSAAIESVKEGIRLSLSTDPTDQYQALATHCLDGIADESQDLILNNPPFHDAGARNPGIALEMFKESRRVLRTNGQLQIVANLHLGYYRRLKDLFGNCETLASNDKFVVLRTTK